MLEQVASIAPALGPQFGDGSPEQLMRDQGRSPARWIIALGVFGAYAAFASVVLADDRVPDAFREDAQIHDIFFADVEHGWAVGDRGTIWHTSDGGEHWRLQKSGVDCRLTSVHFQDARVGWAAGGSTQPYTHVSSGVMLHTRDGGEHWTADRKLLLPAVDRMGFFDAQRGWAIGRESSMFTSSVFATEDGGRSWMSLPTAGPASWQTGELVDPLTGALAGRNGALGLVRRKAIEPARDSDFSLRSYRQLKFVDARHAWLVGDGGLVMQTSDQGQSWQTPPGELPGRQARLFDFHAVDAIGTSCWIAGTPGTRIIHSRNGGQTWTMQSTGQNLPIRAITFLDPQHGFAAGDLGTILMTDDGGQQWRRIRSGGTRAAILGLFSEPGDAPLELLARLSSDEGYLSALEVMSRQDLEVSGDASSSLRFHEAAVVAGASAGTVAWQFPLRHAGLKLEAEQLVESWNRANDGQGLARLESHLVAKIRQWRPDVIFTSSAHAKSSDPRGALINQLVLRAVALAADPQSHRDLQEIDLQPWKAKKVFATLPAEEQGSLNINTTQLALRMGGSLADLAAPAWGLLDRTYRRPPVNLGYRLLIDHIPQELGQRDFFSGIALQPGGDARRNLTLTSDQGVDSLTRGAQTRRNIQAILAQSEAQDSNGARWLGEITDLTRSLRDDQAAEVLFQLAQRYYRNGKWDLAADGFDLLNERYPQHPLSNVALVWLVQYYASGEAQWRVGRNQQIVMQRVQSMGANPNDRQAPIQPTSGVSAVGAVKRAGGVIQDRTGNDSRMVRATNYGRQLEQRHAGLYAEPNIRFPLAVAERNQGLARQAERYYLGLRRTRTRDSWWSCAQAEHWLTDPQGESPKQVWRCLQAPTKPHLDGRLSDALWQTTVPIELRSPLRDDEDWSAVALMSYDAEFLYLGVSCTRAPHGSYVETKSPRPRDADLSDHDRIDFYLDVDRDYATYYRLSIDHRGWTSEACWGDATWNPEWFVAAHQGNDSWTAEAAIPLSELTSQIPQAKTVWAAGAVRVVPRVGVQSWTQPVAVEPAGENFGLLKFE